MEESKLLGTLLPTSDDFFPIVQEMRRKYKLPEVSPDGDPITEIFLNDEPVPLEDFLNEIQGCVASLPNLLPPDTAKLLSQARAFVGMPSQATWLDLIPEADRNAI